MYSRNRHSRINWFQAFFWVLVGIAIGQVIRFDLNLQPRESTLPAQTQTQNS